MEGVADRNRARVFIGNRLMILISPDGQPTGGLVLTSSMDVSDGVALPDRGDQY